MTIVTIVTWMTHDKKIIKKIENMFGGIVVVEFDCRSETCEGKGLRRMSIKGKCCTCGTQRPGHDAPIAMRKCVKCNDGRLKDEEKFCPLCGEEQQEDVLSDFHINKAEALGLTEQVQTVIGRYGTFLRHARYHAAKRSATPRT